MKIIKLTIPDCFRLSGQIKNRYFEAHHIIQIYQRWIAQVLKQDGCKIAEMVDITDYLKQENDDVI